MTVMRKPAVADIGVSATLGMHLHLVRPPDVQLGCYSYRDLQGDFRPRGGT